MSTPRLSIAGRPVTLDDLRPLAQSNYGHFTAFRTRGGAVQGLDLHLARLREGHATLFDAPFDEPALLAQLRQALHGWRTRRCGSPASRATSTIAIRSSR